MEACEASGKTVEKRLAGAARMAMAFPKIIRLKILANKATLVLVFPLAYHILSRPPPPSSLVIFAAIQSVFAQKTGDQVDG